MAEPEIVELHGFAHGGEAVGRLGDGRAVFVAHGIPGERVQVVVTETHKRWARGAITQVLSASPDRVEPPCPYFGPTQCGGCRLQHIAGPRQHALLRQVVVDQLQRLGGFADPPVAETIGAGHYGYRTRARFAVTPDGRLGFRRHSTHDVLPINRCLLLDEPTHQLRRSAGDQWQGVDEVEIRTAAGGSAVVAEPLRAPRVVSGDKVLDEEIDGLMFRVSATSFFQSNRAGAEVLLRLVRRQAGVRAGDSALDLYAGVGLFAAGLSADGAAVTAVEGHRTAAADARHNLHGRAEVLELPVERALPRLATAGRTFEVVVMDPPRRGAGERVVSAVSDLARRSIVVVACDAATLGRDAGTLRRLGWLLREAVPVDQFAQTGHVEVVAVFDRPA